MTDTVGRAAGTPHRAPISAVMIVRDAAATLRRALESLAWVAEVIVYDNGSRDDTRAIAAAFPNVRLVEGQFIGFGPTRNAATALAAHDWIFAIDSDESISGDLRVSLETADFSDPRVVFAVHRRNFVLGRAVRHSGWGNDWIVRLYNRTQAGYDNALVHERVRPGRGISVRRLHGYLDHDAVRRLGDFLVKIDRYTELHRGAPARMHSVPLICARGLWAALKSFILQGGVLDGWRGVVIAYCAAVNVLFKYMKPLADERQADERKNSRP